LNFNNKNKNIDYDEAKTIEYGNNRDKLSEDIGDFRTVRRGWHEEDNKWFSTHNVFRLQKAQQEVEWLLNRGYKIGPITEFVGNTYQFSIRQRNALQRSTCSKASGEYRKAALISSYDTKDEEIYIDGFNLIITLEVAISKGILVLCNDETIRDIAGLRGTYRIIDKTDKAIELIGRMLEELKVSKVNFFLDSPVSNSGKLKSLLLQHGSSWKADLEVELVYNPDPILCDMQRVVTSDSLILDNCISWVNLGRTIIESYLKDAKIIDLSGKK
jgi:hypothetical protein